LNARAEDSVKESIYRMSQRRWASLKTFRMWLCVK